MSNNLLENVEVLSNHYIKRFKHLIDTNRKQDAHSIGEEYLCNGEVSDDDYQLFYVNYQFKLQEEK